MPRRTLNMEEVQEQLNQTLDPLTKKAINLVSVGSIVIISSSFYKKIKGKYVITEVYPKDNCIVIKKMDSKSKCTETQYWNFIEDTKRFLSENINYFRIYKPVPLKKTVSNPPIKEEVKVAKNYIYDDDHFELAPEENYDDFYDGLEEYNGGN